MINYIKYSPQNEPKTSVEDLSRNIDFADENMNLFAGPASNESESENNKPPPFRGLREFRLSVDGIGNQTNLYGQPKSKNFNKSHHRKFTLSFDGSRKSK